MPCNPFQAEGATGECAYTWPVIILAWTILNVAPMWGVLYLSRKFKPRPEDLQNEKTKPFARLDMDRWSYIFAIFTHFLFWPRFLFAEGMIFWACVCTVAITKCFVKKGERSGPFLTKINNFILAAASKSAMIGLTCYWWRHDKIEYCYKKWLGPEWKLDKENGYKKAGTFVMNHQSFLDIFMVLGLLPVKPGFVAKDSIKKVFGIGYICEIVLESLFLKRGDK